MVHRREQLCYLANRSRGKKPGVYLARAKNIRWHYPATLAGLQSIAHLRFLGTRSEIVKMADAKGRDLANEQLELLMEMLSVHVG